MTPGGEPSPFRLTFLPGTIDRLRRWAALARRFGVGPAFLETLREAERQLRTRPREWGDPLFTLRSLQLTVYQRHTPHLVFRYAVHAEQPVVFVRNVILVPRAFGTG